MGIAHGKHDRRVEESRTAERRAVQSLEQDRRERDRRADVRIGEMTEHLKRKAWLEAMVEYEIERVWKS
jgi:hypothetical protein